MTVNSKSSTGEYGDGIRVTNRSSDIAVSGNTASYLKTGGYANPGQYRIWASVRDADGEIIEQLNGAEPVINGNTVPRLSGFINAVAEAGMEAPDPTGLSVRIPDEIGVGEAVPVLAWLDGVRLPPEEYTVRVRRPALLGPSNPAMARLGEAYGYMDKYLRRDATDVTFMNQVMAVVNSTHDSIHSPFGSVRAYPERGIHTPLYLRHREAEFDPLIIAWSNYWTHKLAIGTFGNRFTSFRIRPDVMKAILYKESSAGSPRNVFGRNNRNDVMQTLFPGDPNLWIYAGINPGVGGFYHTFAGVNYMHVEFRNPQGILETNRRATCHRSINTGQRWFRIARDFKTERHFVDTLTIKHIVNGVMENGNLVPVNKETFYMYYDSVTPMLSIALGGFTLAAKVADSFDDSTFSTANSTSERLAVKAYNSLSEEDSVYVDRINNILRDMEAPVLSTAVIR
jgi:hypothetical protein